MRKLLVLLAASVLLAVPALVVLAQQGATVNPIVGSVWTYLGATFGADWVVPPPPGTGPSGPPGPPGPPGSGLGVLSTVTCNGTTDVTTALQTEINAYSAVGGGVYYIQPGKKCVIGGAADFVLPNNVQMMCSVHAGGFAPNGDFAAIADFLLDPAHSIKTTATRGGRSGIFGCSIVRKGFTKATDLRTAISAAQAFAGTAFICDAASSDVSFRGNLLIGFTLAVQTSCDRFQFVSNRGDATNFFSLLACNDACEINDNEAWPFVGNPYQGFPQRQVTNVTSAVISGGTTLTLGFAAPPTPFVTGDTVVVGKIGGITGAQFGRFTATVVDGTHISVPGTFSGSFTSGGTIYLSAMRRTGTAFNLAAGGGGGPWPSALVDFGHDIGIHYTGGSAVQCNRCWLDNDTVGAVNLDPTPIGLLLDGSAGLVNQFDGFINAVGVAVRKDDLSILTIGAGTQMASFNSLVGRSVIEAIRGALQTSTANVFTDFGFGVGSALYIADTMQAVSVIGPGFAGSVTYQTLSTGCPKLVSNGSRGPCVYTPTYTGASIAGTPQQATWQTDPSGRTTVFYLDSGHAVSGQTATQFSISMPTTAAFGGACALGAFAGTLTAGSTQFAVSVGTAGSVANFYQLGSGPLVALPGTALPGTDTIQMTCSYQ